MSGRRSRYNEVKQSSVPRKKRTIRMPGSQENDGRYFRCWNCGFPGNDINRNSIGDGDGMGFEISIAQNNVYGNGQNVLSMQNSERTVLINTTGQAFSERHDISPTVKSGCAFCGCKNYR